MILLKPKVKHIEKQLDFYLWPCSVNSNIWLETRFYSHMQRTIRKECAPAAIRKSSGHFFGFWIIDIRISLTCAACLQGSVPKQNDPENAPKI